METVKKILTYLVSTVLFAVGLFLIFQVALPLFGDKNRETKIDNQVGLKISVPMEFDNNSAAFWWLTKNLNHLEFTNYSDENFSGNLILQFSKNPCKQNTNLKIYLKENEYRFTILDDKLKISIPFEMKNREKSVIDIDLSENQDCKIFGTDQRNFGIRFENWIVK